MPDVENRKPNQPHVSPGDLRKACEAAVLLGYRQGIPAAGEVFYEAYRALVWSLIQRCGLRPEGQPSAEDVVIETFMGLHKRLRQGLEMRRARLSTFVARAALHEAGRALKAAKRTVPLPEGPEDDVQIPNEPGRDETGLLLPPCAVETWAALERQVGGADAAAFAKRVILAYDCIEGQSTGGRCPVSKMRQDWKRLAALSDPALLDLYGRLSAGAAPLAEESVILVAARLINHGAADLSGLPVLLAACEKRGPEETRRMLDRLAELSADDVHQRRTRLYSNLRRP